MKHALVGFVWLLFGSDLFAQGQDTLPGKVTVVADPRIEKILDTRRVYYNLDSSSQGYRIQILMSTNHKEAMLEKENFELKYPDIPIYLKYDSPNFKLRVGDYSGKIEAHYWFVELQDEYPTLFLVPDKVNPGTLGD
ncbi:MAG: hypothetical protein ACYC1Q_03875 [Bacteroidia bacterium]